MYIYQTETRENLFRVPLVQLSEKIKKPRLSAMAMVNNSHTLYHKGDRE